MQTVYYLQLIYMKFIGSSNSKDKPKEDQCKNFGACVVYEELLKQCY